MVKDGWIYQPTGNHVTLACESGWVYSSGSSEIALSNPLPVEYGLSQNHPNPFNPTTGIVFGTDRSGAVEVAVFDLMGRRVRTLVDGVLPAGEHRAIWNGDDDTGRAMASGVYVYRLNTGSHQLARRMVLVR